MKMQVSPDKFEMSEIMTKFAPYVANLFRNVRHYE